MVNISPLARQVLKEHAQHPDELFYATEVLGGLFRMEELADLDRAYEELLRAGLMEPSDEDLSFFGHRKRLMKLTRLGRAQFQEQAA